MSPVVSEAAPVRQTVFTPLLQGHQTIHGLWLPADWFDESERRKRILNAWRSGASLLRFHDGDLLRYAGAVEVDCRAAPGWPLQRAGSSSTLLSAPLIRAELARLPPADLHLVYDATVISRQARDAEPLDPADWLSIAAYALHDTYDEDIVRQEHVLSVPEPALDIRSIFGDRIPPASSERNALLEAIRAKHQIHRDGGSRSGRGTGITGWYGDGVGIPILLWVGAICAMSLGGLALLASQFFRKDTAPVVPAQASQDTSNGFWSWSAFPFLLVIAILAGLLLIASAITILRRRKPDLRSPGKPQSRAPIKPFPLEETIPGIGNAFRIAVIGIALIGLAALAVNEQHPMAPSGILLAVFVLWRWGRRASPRALVPTKPTPPTIPARRKAPPTPSRWRRWAQRLAITSQLSRVLGRRQAAYMRRILDLFEAGDLQEALRHAIPIDGKKPDAGPAFDTPSRRGSLALTDGGSQALGIAMGEDLQTYLRKLYRQSFEKLDREGRIDEAVFVLAELLQARTEALDYLEKKQRYAQAAELALTWDLAPDLIVRLHCLAGNWCVAIAIARRDGAFARTVLQLQGKFSDVAQRLRLEWADALVAQGDWLGAVDAIWPVETERHRAIEWLAKAEAAGGRLGARALVQRAWLLPETLQDAGPQLLALRDDPPLADDRGAIAAALLAMFERGNNKGTNRLTRVLISAILADQSSGRGTLNAKDLQRLLSANGDAALFADVPAGTLPAVVPRNLSTSGTVREWTAPDAGPFPIFDAVVLDDGRLLVALGESGAAIVDGDGRIQRRFAVPAQRIVIAHSRQVALLLVHRDRLWRVSRLDLVSRETSDLGMIELQFFADTFDGIAWTLASDRSIRVLDTQRSLGTALWQFNDLPGPVCGFSACASLDQLLIAVPDGAWERWQYRLPQGRLVGRDDWTPVGQGDAAQVLLPAGGVLELWRYDSSDEPGEPRVIVWNAGVATTITLPDQPSSGAGTPTPSARLRVQANEKNWIMLTDSDVPRRWYLFSLLTKKIHAAVNWPEGAEIRARACGSEWLMFDDRGRMFRFDTETSIFKGISPR